MKKLFPALLLITGLFLLAPGCGSIDKLVEDGDYDAAIERAQRNLSGRDKKNPRYVLALEQAVNRANERDVRDADQLKSRGESADWSAIFRLYDKIDRRQEALQPMIPVVDKNGREAKFRFVRVEPLLVESRQKAADQHYRRAETLLQEGRAGNKSAARQAYAALERTQSYLTNYRNSEAMMREAENLGIVYIVFGVENQTRDYLPNGFEEELLAIRNVNMDSQWRRFHLRPLTGQEYDYRAVMSIIDVDVTPERVSERTYIDEKEITDGTEYVLDENGNVAKDSLGNDITRPRKVIIRADVIEVLQTKAARVDGRLDIIDLDTGNIVERRELTAESIFENYACTYQGDRRALSSQTRQNLGNEPGPFPSNEIMILQAAEELKPILQDELAGSTSLL